MMSMVVERAVSDVTTALAQQVVAARGATIPSAAREAARDAVIDTVGVTLAGSQTEPGLIAIELIRSYASQVGARVIGTPLRASPTDAALINGTSAHALDFDDVSAPLSGHPSSVLVPALFALAEEAGASGADLLDAYVVGFEVAARLGRALNPIHYQRGWHATATLGGPAAAAACAYLLGLDAARTGAAVAIAASLAGGLRTSFGTMVKPLHAGNAARNGVLGALLAARDFSGARDILEAPRGFGELFGQDADWSGLGGTWDWREPQIVRTGIQVKPYPSCAMTHSPIDAMLELRPSLRPEAVEEIECVVDGQAPEVLIYSRPRTGLEAKFSLEYCLAVALLDGMPGLTQFGDRRVGEDDVQRLLGRVEVRVEPSWPREHSDGRFRARVTARLAGGGTRSAEREYPPGSPERPLSRAELERKFIDCAGPVLGDERARGALVALDGLAGSDRAWDVLGVLVAG